ncbi:hypothetical protein B9Z55_002293 [Caenorhabditis nigoni]|uniref:Uncharacterized protein n=1 Tax=Caenorhabditis nigoni TaxID=1611254 RepID=A0A2G5VK87_9PELO|nr:hypothetical protein B9Z55_002293 [Caenorhabditis nigoni]
MAPLSYSAIVTKNRVAEVSTSAPEAPKCSLKISSSKVKLNIKHKRGPANSCGIDFDKAYVEHKISQEIESFGNTDHRVELEEAAKCFKAAIHYCFPDAKCLMTGSLAAGVDIHTSDLDFSVKIPSMTQGSTFSKLKEIENRLQIVSYIIKNEPVFRNVKVQRANVPVLQMKHCKTGVSIDVTIDNDTSKRNTQLLRWYAKIDKRFPLLCKAVKAWASRVGVEGSSKGRLNSFSICLMLINYLQAGVTPAVLPSIQRFSRNFNKDFAVGDEYDDFDWREKIEKDGKFVLDANKSSLAALYLGFLRYYSEFDFKKNWISVKRGIVMEKRWDENKKRLGGLPKESLYIVVEDPFLTVPRNCAGTVRQLNTMERIQEEFDDEWRRTLKSQTIFNRDVSNWRRRMVDSGKARDRQIHEWEKELKALEEEEDDDSGWGTSSDCSTWDSEFTRLAPEEYWEERYTFYGSSKPWPEIINYYLPCSNNKFLHVIQCNTLKRKDNQFIYESNITKKNEYPSDFTTQ